MISSIFFKGQIKDIENENLYEEEYVNYIVSKEMYLKGDLYKEEIESFLINIYGKEIIKNNSIEQFCKETFIADDDLYYISENQSRIIKKVIEFEKDFKKYSFLCQEELYKLINEKIGKEEFEIDNTLKYIIYLQQVIKQKINKEEALYLYYNIQKRYTDLYRTIDLKIDKIDSFYNKIEMRNIIQKDFQLNLLF